MDSREPKSLAEAVSDLRGAIFDEIEPAVAWLDRRMPRWVERLPQPPSWMGPMFWVHLNVWAVLVVLAIAFALDRGG